jgi:hypothetical protein
LLQTIQRNELLVFEDHHRPRVDRDAANLPRLCRSRFHPTR